MAKVIISCAVTGGIHTPSMSPYLPITPEEIARSSIEAAEAGAAIIHLHARDPNDGLPSADPALFMQFLPRIKREGELLQRSRRQPVFCARPWIVSHSTTATLAPARA
jgi:uncharacterized protein (DUF849 family)